MKIVAIRPLSRDVGVAHAAHYKSGSTDALQERPACIESMIVKAYRSAGVALTCMREDGINGLALVVAVLERVV